MRLFFKKRKIVPKCPDCGNRHKNKEIRPNVWKCSSCMRKFAWGPNIKTTVEPAKPPPIRRQIGVDVEDGEEIEDIEDFEVY